MTKTFTVAGYKGVREITLTPSGSLVVIAGANGAGKSSFIDAFVELFDPKGTRLTPMPIREGESEARAEFTDTDLGARIVRTWKQNDAGKLEVFALDGAKYSKPSDMVASLTGGLIFDPVAFLNLDERKQRDALLAKVDLPFDLDELEREKAGAEARRLDQGREVKRLQGALAVLPKPAPDTPDEEVSAQSIIDELRAAEDHNRSIETSQAHVNLLTGRVAELERELETARESLAAAQRGAAETPIDVDGIRARLASVEDTNAAVRSAREYGKVADALAAAEQAHAAAQAELDAVDQRKRAGLAEAVFPVPGLSVDDTGITFNGVPFSQVNTAARKQVAFAIATAGDPKLKLVIVKDGDLLDADSLDAIRALADDRDYTVLVERDRDESRQIGFTIVDGVLAEAVSA